MITRQSLSEFGGSLENLLRVLAGIIQQNEAEKVTKGFFTPRPTGMAEIGLPTGGYGETTMPIPTGIAQQPNFQNILQALMSQNPFTKEAGRDVLGGLGTILKLTPEQHVVEGQTGEFLSYDPRNPSGIKTIRSAPPGLGQRTPTTRETGRVKTEGGIRYKEIQDVDAITLQPMPGRMPRWEAWTNEPTTETPGQRRGGKITDQLDDLRADLAAQESIVRSLYPDLDLEGVSGGRIAIPMSPETKWNPYTEELVQTGNKTADANVLKWKSMRAKLRELESLKGGKTWNRPANNQLDDATARRILQEAGGDKMRARQIARQRGYRF